MSIRHNGNTILTTGFKSVNLTKEEYDALPDSKLTDGVYYNITDDEDTSNFVSILPQTFTNEQKAQARSNIGAQPSGSYITTSEYTERFRVTYNANTDRTDTTNRKNAILYVINKYPQVEKCVIRYVGGYYYCYEFYRFSDYIYITEICGDVKYMSTWRYVNSDVTQEVLYS